jgi:hypothetical protein
MMWAASIRAHTDTRGISNRVIRGGSFNNDTLNLLASTRNNIPPANRNNNVGFRCAKTRGFFFFAEDVQNHTVYVQSAFFAWCTQPARARRSLVHPGCPCDLHAF